MRGESERNTPKKKIMIRGPSKGLLQLGGDGMSITVFGFVTRSVGASRSVERK